MVCASLNSLACFFSFSWESLNLFFNFLSCFSFSCNLSSSALTFSSQDPLVILDFRSFLETWSSSQLKSRTTSSCCRIIRVCCLVWLNLLFSIISKRVSTWFLIFFSDSSSFVSRLTFALYSSNCANNALISSPCERVREFIRLFFKPRLVVYCSN